MTKTLWPSLVPILWVTWSDLKGCIATPVRDRKVGKPEKNPGHIIYNILKRLSGISFGCFRGISSQFLYECTQKHTDILKIKWNWLHSSLFWWVRDAQWLSWISWNSKAWYTFIDWGVANQIGFSKSLLKLVYTIIYPTNQQLRVKQNPGLTLKGSCVTGC